MRQLLALLGVAGVLALAADGPARSDEEAAAAFFNGKDLEGWVGRLEFWTVKDGALVGSHQGINFNTFLCSKKKYGDFELQFQVRLKGTGANSGVQIRSEIFDREKFAVKGPQCDIGQGFWGTLYGEHWPDQRGGPMKTAPKDLVQKVLREDEFNDYAIRCVGKHVTLRLNGTTTVDDDFPKMPDTGLIAWQLHAGQAMEVTFKDIKFKDLGDSDEKATPKKKGKKKKKGK